VTQIRENTGGGNLVAIVETEALTKRFGSLTAVDQLTIAVEEGSVFGLLGPNGAGKTTVIKMLTTLLPVTSGKARVAGFDIMKQQGGVRRNIGYVPQLISTDGNLTGFENLLVFAKLYDIPSKQQMTKVRDAVDFMGLTEAAGKLVKTYSGGMIRRLEIAESMLHNPRILFLDEPTIGLDPLARKTVWDHVRLLRKDFGMTILLTTHLMEEADSLCTRIAIMHHGKVVAIGTVDELKRAVGEQGTTLDEVFIHYTGDSIESGAGGQFRDISRTRRTAKRLG
jgi:ABC-2 type transport system ATP-binding protein